MAIDFRIRPPYGKFKSSNLFKYQFTPNDLALEGPTHAGVRRIASASELSVEKMVQEMDLAGIDVGVLMGRKTLNPATPGDSDNYELFELANKYPGRFVVFPGIHPAEPDWREQLTEFAKRGAKGISVEGPFFSPAIHNDDPSLIPVYEECERLGLILSLALSIYIGPDITYSSPVPIQHIAMRFPKLKIVVPHAAWPHTMAMLGIAMLCPNVYLMPDTYFYTPHIPLADAIADAANGYLMRQLLFASAYPNCGFQQSLEGWQARPLSRQALLYSLHYNAARILGL